MKPLHPEAGLNLYITAPHPCPYQAGYEAVNLLVDPSFPMTSDLYGRLLERGFRRSGNDVYRPHCQSCTACVPTRIAVAAFRPDRSQRRNWRRNQDVQVVLGRGQFKPEHARLYQRYISARHSGGGMDGDPAETFAGFILSSWCPGLLVEFRVEGQLLAVAAVDELPKGLSAVYTFFDPEAGEARGLGTFAVLWQIAHARQRGLPYVYPGYWIQQSRKMRYKTRFQPLEGLVGGVWQRIP